MNFAAEHPGVECQISKPGSITSADQYFKIAMSYVLSWTFGPPRIDVTECAAAMIEQVIEGYCQDTLGPKELSLIGREALAKKEGGSQC